ncbi:MAG TPA: tetrahydromethanopterin S-methyltransferase subunit H [Methanoregulaceae archaeon]|jgi:tetrahydromethanopterin S-methyltransferase subunit H|nr:tetrahydromethanopterin S-methyltransferase subunit H [Methanoregulaceae archaeon]MDD5049065.1 tetrahydromethanopterin S-methyltransferase subunit H [Methanoregulaceae archaeon]MDD5684915.1 tetrahydromethanopterin S-methyltransferase subunit H [Methanoregulaceae archaeon]HOP66960.1 tetrahydromethanopterin S-methyltransferase subunit H [Methanoregulaceae archaeon]HPJ73664.1 tetrahydromethanopterin S-methyltransferase subunit H [Methanoregulaceae archaeon]
MFRFEKEQSVWDFNGTMIGGQPGEYPTVLAASIFYNKHEVVLDDKTGKIDKETAEALWNRCQELSDLTGLPHFIQIIAEYPEAFESYFTWFDSIDNKTAFLMDSSVPAALAHACKYTTEVGLADRAIYNSINGSIPPENIEAIKNSDVNAAIVLAFNPGDPSVVGREKVLVEGGVAGQEKGMLQIAEEAGITRPILDTAATPLGIGSGGAYREILACKAIHGYPTGGAYHNMTVSWTWLKRWKGTKKNPSALAEGLKGKDKYTAQLFHHYKGGMDGVIQAAWSAPDIGCNMIASTLGADLIMYGPIENVEAMITAQAYTDIAVLEAAQQLGVQCIAESHPFYKLI